MQSPMPSAAPIAIVGMQCRLPGATDVDAFWELLATGGDAVAEIPRARFDIDEWHDPEPGTPNRIVSRDGGFLHDIELFDAAFFGLSPREALRVDPRHRLILETTWEALEDAGLTAEGLRGSRTGVYVGCLGTQYWDVLREAGISDLHSALGAEVNGMAAARLSYELDLRGPSVALDASCATSLFGVHLACQSLRLGETDAALVASANLLLTPETHTILSEAQLMSPSGRCRFGDAAADGYVRSEGVGALVLKRLDQAVADGDRVHALVLGSGAVQDGRTGETLIAPGIDSQAGMLRAAYAMAGVAPADVDYVEAHGPGTVQGDHAELSALGIVLGEGRPADRPAIVGSVKSNIGHTEPTAGLAALIKAVLAMRHRTIPRTLHVEQPNPVLRQAGSPLRLALERQPWPQTDRRAVAGASAFGLSGTNVHVVLAEPPPVPAPAPAPLPQAFLLPLSARSDGALRDVARRYRERLRDVADPAELRDVCFSASVRRSHHDHRAAVAGSDVQELLAGLDALAAGRACEQLAIGGRAGSGRPRVVFVFPGQGSQWLGMGRGLLDSSPAFAEALRACDEAIRGELGWSLIERLRDAEPLAAVDEIQPALWAMEVALAAVWRERGIEPDLLIGHSMGEIAAATVSGALTVREAAAVVCRRARLLLRLAGGGAMAFVQLGEAEARTAIAACADRVSVGVVNSEHSCVLSGEPAAIAQTLELLRERGVYCQLVQVDYASHSPQIDAIAGDLTAALADLRPRAGSVPLHSTLHDRVLTGAELDGTYWTRNLREPVLFGAAINAALAGEGPVLFVEVSPHPLLLNPILDGVEAAGHGAAIGSLRRDEPEECSLLAALGAAYAAGCTPRWEALNRGARYVPLPHYPWQRKRYWPEVAPAQPRPEAVPETPPASMTVTLRMEPGGGATLELHGVSASALPPAPIAAAAANGAPAGVNGAARATLPPSRDDLQRCVLAEVARVLELDPAELDAGTPLTKVGLDSLLAAKLRRRILHELGIDVSVRQLLRGRTAAQVAEQLREQGALAGAVARSA